MRIYLCPVGDETPEESKRVRDMLTKLMERLGYSRSSCDGPFDKRTDVSIPPRAFDISFKKQVIVFDEDEKK